MSWFDKLDDEQLQNANLISEEAKKAGISPRLAVSLAFQESGLRHNKGKDLVRSGKGATGIMQLMPGTAKELNVDPVDKIQNIRGGINYLKMLMDRPEINGDPYLAVTAYNAGPNNPFFNGGDLPDETKNYVQSIKTLGGFDAAPSEETVSTNETTSTGTGYGGDGLNFADLIIPAGAAAAGTTLGTGIGAYREKGINAAQDKTRSVLIKIDELIRGGKVDQARTVAEAAFGNKPLTFTPPPPKLSAGEKWAGKITHHVVPNAESVVDQSQAWQRAKGHGPVMSKFHKMFPPAAPGEPMGAFERMLSRAEKADEASKAATLTQAEDLEKIRSLASKAQVSSGLDAGEGVLGKIASVSQRFPKTFGAVSGGLGGAGAALGGIEAMESYQKNDIPMFVMNALQTVGSLAGIYPPAALAGFGLASAGALGGHLIQNTREGSAKVSPKEIEEVEESGPARSIRGFGFRP
jgi:hypothetical protein